MIRRALSWFLAGVLCVAAIPACAASSRSPDDPVYLSQLNSEIDRVIEAGHEAEPVPALSQEERMVLEVRMHRRQVADEMRASVAEAMTPLAFAAALFAPDGPVDLVLTAIPVDRLGGATVKLARHALEVRRDNKRARKLIRLHRQFEGMLDADAREFLHTATKLTRAQRHGLKVIMEHTRSPAVVEKLLYQQYNAHADVGWIARKLERKKAVDADFVERFTFDGGIVEDITLHDSNISWRTLQDIVEGAPVDKNTRAIMASKLRGVMGERAARRIVQSRAFKNRYLQRPDQSLASGLGASYGMRYGKNNSSIDIMLYSQQQEAIFVEVKTWSAQTWTMNGQKDRLFDQLGRHDSGILEITDNAEETRTIAAKVLMVEQSGFEAAMSAEADREAFMSELGRMGWDLETIPSRDVPRFGDIIDGLR